MSNTWILFYVFLMFVVTSVCTYSKTLKESWIFLFAMVSTALLGSWLWVIANRRLDKIADQLWFSLVWDILMVIAYYVIPLFFCEHKMNWQSWAAVGMIAVGILWFKAQTNIV